MRFSRQEYWSGVPLPSPVASVGTAKFLRSGLFGFRRFELYRKGFTLSP